MVDYSERNEKFQKFIDESGLTNIFKFTGENDIWEYVGSYPHVKFIISNKSRNLETLLKITYDCGRLNERDEQIKFSVNAFENLITPPYSRQIII
jgi:hypothetical protein